METLSTCKHLNESVTVQEVFKAPIEQFHRNFHALLKSLAEKLVL